MRASPPLWRLDRFRPAGDGGTGARYAVVMPELPTGHVTFVFTDIEGSTAMLQRLGRDTFLAVLEDHNRLIREAFALGVEVRTEGDAFFYAFSSPADAVSAALVAQRALALHSWPHGGNVKVRMGMHSGEGSLGGGDYVGLDVHRAARVAAAGHGGQVLMTSATHTAAGAVEVLDLGQHAFKDVVDPEHVFQAVGSGPRVDFPPIRSLNVRSNNLPAQASEFIGRTGDVAAVADLLTTSRAVTITGPGGTGKTRLAVQVASRVLSRYTDGVTYVPLESLRDHQLVISVLAAALEVEVKESTPMEAVSEALTDRTALLVLDNFEHVLEAAGPIARILQQAPGIHVLATSQALLRIRGEHAYPLAPMDPGDAVALFVARAKAAEPSFEPSESDHRDIASLVERLEGMPLATELAAARIRLFGVQGLLDRVSAHFEFSDTSSDMPDRHRTTRAAIAWSYDLLDEQERHALRLLSVFDGGFTLDAAEAVVGARALDLVASLLDKSLITSNVLLGEARFSMLESIRRFADEQLETGEASEAGDRHGHYFADLGVRVRPLLEGKAQQVWLGRIEAEHDNLRAVVRRSIERSDPEWALLAVGSTWRYFHRRGHNTEARQWLETLLALPGGGNRARAQATDALAAMEYWRGKLDDAMDLYRSSLALFEELGDGERVGDALFALSAAANFTGDFDLGHEYGLRSQAAYEQAGISSGVRKVKASEAYRIWRSGDLENGLIAWEEARDLFAKAGNVSEELQTEMGISAIRFEMGDTQGAFAGALSALERMWEIKDVPGSIALLAYAGSILTEPEPDGALRLGAAAIALRTRSGGALRPGDYGFQTAQEILEPTIETTRYAVAVAAGEAFTLDDAVAEALTLLERVTTGNTSTSATR